MPSFLHTCYRIGEIDRSVEFYEKLGFEEVARMPIGDEAINVFMGMPGEDPRLELTYNHGVDYYEHGSGYNHIALAVDDLDGTLEDLAAAGDRARKASLPPRRSHRGPPHLLRPRPRRLPHRADRRVGRAHGFWPRRSAKNSRSSAAHSSSLTPPLTWGRWLSAGSASTSRTLPAAPALGSGAP